MILSSQTIDFLQFMIVGAILALVFDIFRAYRMYSKDRKKYIVLQDIIFFCIALIILLFSIFVFLDNPLRLFLFFAMFLGVIIYLSVLSKFVVKVYIKVFELFKKFIAFLLLPINFLIKLSKNIYTFLDNFVKKTCKRMKYVIFYLYSKIKGVKIKFFKFNIQKRVKNEKFKKKERRGKKKNWFCR